MDALLSLKEVQKLTSSKEELISLLSSIAQSANPVISLNEAKTEGKIIINDKMILYSFINLPQHFTYDNVIQFFSLEPNQFSRLYKQSLFWVLVSENEDFNSKFEKKYKALQVEDNKPVKCNVTSSRMLKNAISKIIQHDSYIKETGDLKASGNNSRKESFQKSAPSGDGSEMSWRKKSDVTDFSTNSNNNFGYKKRRQRFKSDNNDFSYRNNLYKAKNEVEEIQIQLDNVKYPLIIKNKYSNKEMVDFYNKIKNSVKYDKANFKNEIEDIMMKEQKTKLAIAERDNLNNEMPKNNPLLNF